jgi:hypothetical protein
LAVLVNCRGNFGGEYVMMLRGLSIAVLGCVFSAVFAAAEEELVEASFEAAQLTEAVAFELEDQFKEPHSVAFPSDKVTFLILADRKGSDEVEGWITALYEKYEDDIAIKGVAKLQGVPGLMQGLVRKLFKKGVDYPVMMDWDGTVCDAYGYEEKQANVFVIDKDGEIALTLVGPSEEANVAKVCEMIDSLMTDSSSTNASSAISRASD